MKSTEESFERCKGLFNITVTPFDRDGAIDSGALEANIGRVLDLGYDGLLIGGTYGEFPAMSAVERSDLFRAVMSQVGDRVPVLLCTAGSDLREVKQLTELAGTLGGLPMVTAPYVSEVNDGHIEAYFREVTPLSPTGIMIYNAPGIGITLSPSLIQRLAEVPGVVALKQGELGMASIDVLVSLLSGRIRMFAASDLTMIAPLAAGFDGLSSTNSCGVPEVVIETYRAVRSGDLETARRRHLSWYPIRACARELGQPQVVKAVMNARGFAGGHVRRPLLDLEGPARHRVEAALATVRTDPDSRMS